MPCVAEMPSLERLYSKLKEKGFTILAIGGDDDPERLREFQRQFGLSFPVLYDTDGDVQFRYHVSGFPESFLIDREGKLTLLPDPYDNMPTIRIVGPREWDSPNVMNKLSSVTNR